MTKGVWYVGTIFPLPNVFVDGKKVCSISKDLPIYERESNARVISAAPDLYDALQLVVGSMSLERVERFDILEKCKAALIKAAQ